MAWDVAADNYWIKNLQPGWDNNHAQAIGEDTFVRMCFVVKKITFQVEETIIHVIDPIAHPSIGPVSDGSIDVLWNYRRRNLLMNFPHETSRLPEFYGQVDGSLSFLKGTLIMGEEEMLVLWLLR